MAPMRVTIQQQLAAVRLVAQPLDPQSGGLALRRTRFSALQKQFAQSEAPFEEQLSKMMARWTAGLFVGGKAGKVPWDNLDLERWFRLPKGHERRIHGHKHAGVRIVREGPTLLPALDAHQEHEGLFSVEELRPYSDHPVPADQVAAQHRHQVMRQGRSTKQRTKLLQELEQQYLDAS